RHKNSLELGAQMYHAINQAASNIRENGAFSAAIEDPHLSFNELTAVLQSPPDTYKRKEGEDDLATISGRYDHVRKNINLRNLKTEFATQHDGNKPDAVAERVLANLCRPDFYEE